MMALGRSALLESRMHLKVGVRTQDSPVSESATTADCAQITSSSAQGWAEISTRVAAQIGRP